jgi:hypothetical protein
VCVRRKVSRDVYIFLCQYEPSYHPVFYSCHVSMVQYT